jgi:hypothetical protein
VTRQGGSNKTNKTANRSLGSDFFSVFVASSVLVLGCSWLRLGVRCRSAPLYCLGSRLFVQTLGENSHGLNLRMSADATYRALTCFLIMKSCQVPRSPTA